MGFTFEITFQVPTSRCPIKQLVWPLPKCSRSQLYLPQEGHEIVCHESSTSRLGGRKSAAMSAAKQYCGPVCPGLLPAGHKLSRNFPPVGDQVGEVSIPQPAARRRYLPCPFQAQRSGCGRVSSDPHRYRSRRLKCSPRIRLIDSGRPGLSGCRLIHASRAASCSGSKRTIIGVAYVGGLPNRRFNFF